MTHPGNTTASPNKTVLGLPTGVDLDERSRRARTEPMAVTGFGTSLYEVETESDRYLVDVAAGRCTCPDHIFRGVRCKHLRRVAIEINEGLAPPPGQVAVPCRDCGRTVFVDAETVDDEPHYCRGHRLYSGDTARDRETGRRVVVVTPPGGRADRVPVPGTDRTVAEYDTNSRYGPDDPVVGVVYPGGRVTDEGVVPEQLRVYAFPRSRLRRVDPAPELSAADAP
jgi:hypothetical protein